MSLPRIHGERITGNRILNGPACSSVNKVRLNNSLAAREISGGHAFEKHVLSQGEFSGLIRTRNQFSKHIENILNNTSILKTLRNNRTGYWHQETGTIVVRNPRALDGGTAFQPSIGFNYFHETLR